MTKEISSTQNPLIKQLVQLTEKSRERRKNNLFVIEGVREISLALQGGYSIETLCIAPDICTDAHRSKLLTTVSPSTEVIFISTEVYQKIAYRTTTEGVIAIANAKTQGLSSLSFNKKNPLILIAEAPEKPGNIGALLRTADAAALDAVIIANPLTDLYNPNIIRSSVGCVFTNQIATGTTQEIISWLKQQEIATYCAALSASVPYHSVDFTQASAIVVGTEATGLSETWLEHSTQNIIIPMQGAIDSMNVSVAAAIITFEAKRQRGFQS
ncbi:TrmH family RNA methyltransferase [Imtechella halotolerans]|uniref:tRNA/rRNA methyltransferase n=1 Tax=Imtechella halotolerans K1 TaxID=946077 RepID=I0WFV5_9FLAO|nr:RNA methyltransferase [Imtechella halotolerans]EID75271.1 tRNA/rRNA methyltransferase [Imtechella halotolerans K1]WMQ63908.1 RNA methyltransferase [Imtechella halotolerans]